MRFPLSEYPCTNKMEQPSKVVRPIPGDCVWVVSGERERVCVCGGGGVHNPTLISLLPNAHPPTSGCEDGNGPQCVPSVPGNGGHARWTGSGALIRCSSGVCRLFLRLQPHTHPPTSKPPAPKIRVSRWKRTLVHSRCSRQRWSYPPDGKWGTHTRCCGRGTTGAFCTSRLRWVVFPTHSVGA